MLCCDYLQNAHLRIEQLLYLQEQNTTPSAMSDCRKPIFVLLLKCCIQGLDQNNTALHCMELLVAAHLEKQNPDFGWQLHLHCMKLAM